MRTAGIADHAMILDLDGVLAFGSRPAPGVARFLRLLDDRPFVVLTNNSLVTGKDVANRFARHGLTLSADRVLTVSDVLQDYLRRTCTVGESAVVLGARPVQDAVKRAGLVPARESAALVVVALSLESTWSELGPAIDALRRGARLIAANDDPVLLGEEGLLPATGAVIAALRSTMPGRQLSVEVVGKPGRTMFNRALATLGSTPRRTVVVGDSLGSDVAGGLAIGAVTILLTCGVTPPDAVLDPVPDIVLPDLEALSDLLEARALTVLEAAR